MSQQVTRLDIPSVEEISKNLDVAVQDFAEALATLKEVTTRLYGCWGDDEPGRAFELNYLNEANGLLEGSDLVIEDLVAMRETLLGIARAYQGLDEFSGGVLELDLGE
ncbi:MAG TPA: hypothetical protein VGQ99_07775 [Tepidisphaeraceae bacterium]|jgi:hypothetical protein|nr:hypothetical protein [Tepidisphaeraceae bacterium]